MIPGEQSEAGLSVQETAAERFIERGVGLLVRGPGEDTWRRWNGTKWEPVMSDDGARKAIINTRIDHEPLLHMPDDTRWVGGEAADEILRSLDVAGFDVVRRPKLPAPPRDPDEVDPF